MADFEFDSEKLKADTDEVNRQKRLLSIMGGIGDTLASSNSVGNFALGKVNGPSNEVSRVANAVADTYEDPAAAQSKAFGAYKQSNEASKMRDENALLTQKKDPNSSASKSLKQIAGRWGIQVTPDMSAYDIEQMIDPKKMMETEAMEKARFGNQLALQNNSNRNQQILKGMDVQNEQRRNDREKAEKAELKESGLRTPFGLANTEDDAKQLKGAFESKQNFDSKLNEMISLREKHGGGAMMNREDVARGKQLSKDLLLEYKNMAKLGVLSSSDEAIINAIIPEDPLEYNSPLAALQGQDPTLSRLKKFKGDSEKDFTTKVGTRTRAGIGSIANEKNEAPPVQKTPQQLAAEELERRRAAKQTARR